MAQAPGPAMGRSLLQSSAKLQDGNQGGSSGPAENRCKIREAPGR